MYCQPGFAHSTDPGQRDESSLLDRFTDPVRVLGPSDELGELMRQVGREARLSARADYAIMAKDSCGRFPAPPERPVRCSAIMS